MKRPIWPVFAVLFLGSYSLAQTNQAAMTATPHEVKQGEQVMIQVKISPAPNIAGRVDVFAAPEGLTSPTVIGGNGVSPGQTNVGEIGITMPVDAKLGRWRVVEVRFQPGNSASHDLTISGTPIFEVVKRDTVLPTSADVQVK